MLLVIDLQQGWRHQTATEAVVQKVVRLCESYQGTIIHSCFRNEPSSLFHSQLNWTRMVEPPDIDPMDEIKNLTLPTYWRTTYSCLTAELLPVVKAYDHVYIAGVFTDISVFTTALDLFDHNIVVSVLSDCVATLHGEEQHQSSLRSLRHAIGTRHVILSSELLSL
jgi:nicotinamidase-related amidase